ncbi:MAG: VWA domain-containing protein [Candidatus Gastranaerophilales bacterium]|nr:VWA domain-containing protein [Candidatus Gastranaerophilales bacterium]
MIFESMWPLALLASVPVVIILYLLKPRGKDYRISSNLLWDKLFRNQQSKTFLEKFIHNILMYLQILILMLLVLALMSPYIHGKGAKEGNRILVFDTSGSMQHDAGNGRTRMEEAVRQAKELIAGSEDTVFSIVTNDCMGTELLAVGIKDRASLYAALDQISCCDGTGRLSDAESVVETLKGVGGEADEDAANTEVILFTDGNGAEDAVEFAEYFDAQVLVMGQAVDNVSNNFLSYTRSGDENDEEIVCASSLTNYGASEASMEISLYEGERLLEVKQLTLGAGETTLCFFQELTWQGETLRSELGSIRFAESGAKDSLSQDNIAYAIPSRTAQIDAALVGDGNTYIEKAYQAVTGMSLPKVQEENALGESDAADAPSVRIYDAQTASDGWEAQNALLFDGEVYAADTVERVMLTAASCDLTSGLTSFSLGVNETKVYELPDWGIGFLWAGEQCAGYYGEHDGVKTVVVGFDIRESDFPLKAEFPIFISNVLHFLGDDSLLTDNVYEAGETVLFHPRSDLDVNTLYADTKKAGLYQVEAGEITERYVVRFATGSQSDGQITEAGIASDTAAESGLVKRRLGNVALAVALCLLVLEWFLYVRQMRSRNKFYLAVRLIGAAFLLLALFGVSISKRDSVNTTIFLVDLSNSNEKNLEEMERYIDALLQEMPSKNQYGIVTFGKNSLVEQFLTGEKQFSQIMSLPDKTATNFEEAVSRALAMIPSDGAGRIVFLTDGKETRGDLTGTALALNSRQVELLAYIYETDTGQDAYVENVELPSYLYQGDAYTMTVTVESNYEMDAELQIWMGTTQTDSHAVHLNRGTNRFRFQQTVTGENVESFEVRVAANGDTCGENDSYHAYSVVESVPKVLLIGGIGEDSSEFERVLAEAGCNYSRVSALNAPSALEGMLEYKSMILENVYLPDLPEGFLQNIETYVRDYGCGLICCGGGQSFALGGYRDSVLESVLPVDMELRGVNESAKTAMIMVIDHSGSMGTRSDSGATDLDLAITAAETAVDQMSDTDYVGVITFDDQYDWVVEPTQASDKEAIKSQIETIAEGGGTSIQPALWAALDGVVTCDASLFHVILLTDGQGESSNYSNLVSSYQEKGVTLSAVAVGQGADTALLERIATLCGGRYYYSDMASEIPKIFAQEVFLSGDTYLQNGTFELAVNSGNEITSALFEDGWPQIYGYVSATPKNSARILIASEKDDPVLSIMQYGLGHTVAWNTDVANRWTAGYAGADDYVQLWKRIVDYSVGNQNIGEDSLNVMTAGGYTSLIYQAQDYAEQTKVEAVYTDPDGNTFTEPLLATAPGVYEAQLDTDMTGLYHLSVRRADGGEVVNAVTTAAAVQYSDEYKFRVNTSAFTAFVERYGRLLKEGEMIWQQRKSGSKARYDLTRLFLVLAILWFVLDIAVRRFHFLPQDTRIYRVICARRQAKKEKPFKEAIEQGVRGVQKSVQNAAAETESASADEDTGKKTKKQTKKEKKGKRDSGQTQALDTSALLKKKDQRNQ